MKYFTVLFTLVQYTDEFMNCSSSFLGRRIIYVHNHHCRFFLIYEVASP